MPYRWLLTWPLPSRVTRWQSIGVGVGIALVAELLRLALEQIIPGRSGFVTFFPSVVLSSYVAGAPAGFIVVTSGIIGGALSWLGPAVSPSVAVICISALALTGAMVSLIVAALRTAIFDLAERDLRAHLVNRELMHRNRNLFAIVTSLAGQTLDQAGIDREISASLRERILALSRAQELISFSEKRGVSLRGLVDRVLAPMVPEPGRLSVEGSWIGVPGDKVIGLTLVLHELGTNALKYGAWSNNSGRTSVHWEVVPSGISVTWQEQDGPPIAVPERYGLGSKLIDRALPGTTVERSFEPSGLKVVMAVPLEVVDHASPAAQSQGVLTPF